MASRDESGVVAGQAAGMVVCRSLPSPAVTPGRMFVNLGHDGRLRSHPERCERRQQQEENGLVTETTQAAIQQSKHSRLQGQSQQIVFALRNP